MGMYKQILVAVDGSKQANHALIKASQIAKRYDAHLVIVHMVDTRGISWSRLNELNLWNETKKHAEELLENSKQKAESLGAKDVRTVLLPGNPRVEIPKKLVSEYNVDLLIVGGSGKNAVERLLIGSVTDAATRLATCDLLTVKAEAQESKYNNILIAVDGSEQAERALRKAIKLANIHDAKLIISHMINYEPGPFSREGILMHKEKELNPGENWSEKQMLVNYKREAESQGLDKVEIVLYCGNPRKDIPQTLTSQFEIDLLITAATGRGVVERILIGSVAHAAVQHAPCDVLTVRN